MISRAVGLIFLASAMFSLGGQPDLVIWGPVMNPKIVTRTYTSTSCDVKEGCVVAGTRRLLIFDTESRNIGDGNLVLGSPVGNPLFEYAACHGHYHFRDFADYRLVDPARQEVAAGLKVGFCLLDSRRWDTNAPAAGFYSCDNQGIQAGWADIYSSSLPCQWIDITSLAGGVYTLEVEVDPENRLAEANETNNTTRVFVAIDEACSSAPPNDTFATAQLLQLLKGPMRTVIGGNSCATREPSEPQHAGNTASKSIWYHWTPNYTGIATITTFGSTLDTVLAVYRGTAVSSLTPVASNDDAVPGQIRWSRVTFSVTNGVPLMIAVDGYLGATGGVALNVNPAVNDQFTNSVSMSGTTGNATTVNLGATNEPGEPLHGALSLWYSWMAPSNAVMEFATHGSTVDTQLAVYQGSGLSNLVAIVSNDDAHGRLSSAVRFRAVAGTTYFIAVAGRDEGLVSLTWQPAILPIFTSIVRSAPDVYRVSISGRVNDRYLIQHSPDLQSWQEIGSATNVTGAATYDGSGSGLSGFYRAILQP
jgi:hypothetical protein